LADAGKTVRLGKEGHVIGAMIDRWPARVVGASVLGCGAAGALFILAVPSAPSVWLAAALLGLCFGAEIDIIAYLAARIFPPERFATLFGIIVGLVTFGGGIGPLIAAIIYDHAGSYRPWFWATAAILSFAAALVGTISPEPVSASEQ